jgi:hypothetical protein
VVYMHKALLVQVTKPYLRNMSYKMETSEKSLEAISKTPRLVLPDGSTTHRVVDDALAEFIPPWRDSLTQDEQGVCSPCPKGIPSGSNPRLVERIRMTIEKQFFRSPIR